MAAVVKYRDQIAMVARGRNYPEIEPKWVEATGLESQAQRQANALRKALKLPAIPKLWSGSIFYKSPRF